MVLPEPDSPTTPSVRLRRMSIETPSTAFTQLRGSLRTVSKLCRPRFTAAARPRFGYPHLFDAGNLTREGRISDDELSRHRRARDRLWHTDSSFTKDRTTYSLLLAHIGKPGLPAFRRHLMREQQRLSRAVLGEG